MSTLTAESRKSLEDFYLQPITRGNLKYEYNTERETENPPTINQTISRRIAQAVYSLDKLVKEASTKREGFNHLLEMKFSIIATAAQLLAVSLAYTISEGTIKVGEKSVSFGEFNTQEVKQLPIESPKDKIDINLKINDDLAKRPHQVVLSLASIKDSALAAHFVPTFTVSNQIKASIPVNKLPEVLKIQDKLLLSLIIGDQVSGNLDRHLVEIIPGAEYKETSKYVEKPRVGRKQEIHHIFREDPKTINAIIPVAFIGAAVVLTLGLFASWVGFIGADLTTTFKTITTTQLTYNVSFLVTIIGFEVNFIKYYLGQNIFTTLFNSFILGLPSIYFGSKVLRSLRENRKVGRF
ncbi:uncharacterized protein CANTADRAFT_7840 [Suhomyces tanzawaensis NRRL Y-17324]|uniref:Ribophorin II C-terminal domain-containing protein n=1 Tax=Suhomyces tanzawaensis NRRL Y-17324 TaxID=984487 RepID=A0A1E4SCY6_9ASCO|nr:uncharacterized protein CANTADRAFT_7840 [Suhomyces tanzawaensis NRRL Y-17324]ODV77365.1 hypothetical protein CANTADRAFT_7840 [Suhomyces tanzawaensis NRRL Y-17324]